MILLSHVQSVERVLEELNIDHVAYWYCATDAKAEIFDVRIADIQLYHLWKNGQVLTDEDAASFKEDTSTYLQTVAEVIFSH